jgi:hypothetical protein
MRRSAVATAADLLGEHFRLSWEVLRAKSREHEEAQRQIARLRGLPGFPVMQRAWRMQRKMRASLTKR